MNIQFKDGMLAVAAALSAGYSVENAFVSAWKEMVVLYGEGSDIAREFQYIANQMRMNQTIERAMCEFGERTGIGDIQNFAQVFAVSKRTGGELAGVIRNTAEVIGDKIQVREEIQTMLSARKYEQRLMSLMPLFIIFYLNVTSPEFLGYLYQTWTGRMIMSGCLLTYGAANLLAGRMIRIEV